MHDDDSTIQLQNVRSRERLTETPTISAPSTPGPEPHSEDDSLSTKQSTESNHEPNPPKASAPLRRTVYPVFLVLLYSVAALYAWVIICILTHRPIGGVGYGIDQYNATLENWTNDKIPLEWYLDRLFDKSEKYFRAARVVQALVSVVTIPLTSAVCSQAAVVYLQQKRWRNGPTLRQSMALADKGWTDINLISKLILGGWKKYSSALLLFALSVHLLGFAISPVQQLFLSYKTIKRFQSAPGRFGEIATIGGVFLDDFFYDGDFNGRIAHGLNTVKLRSKLASTSNTEVQTRLWSRGNHTISLDDQLSLSDRLRESQSYSLVETKSQNTLGNLSVITDPFWAQLPTSTTTGLLQQFAPRMNSTANWENNTAGLPENCNPSSDAFYINYVFKYDGSFAYDIEICMPGNASHCPWKEENSRQGISEELYLRMNFTDTDSMVVTPGIYSKKLTLQTTMGYFELPNYANGGFPGPLMTDGHPAANYHYFNYKRDLGNDSDTASNILKASNKVDNYSAKGPLLSIALALFGEGSFVDVEHTSMEAYAQSNVSDYDGCIALIPFTPLLDVNDPNWSVPFNPCLKGDQIGGGMYSHDLYIHSMVASFFYIFSGGSDAPSVTIMENAFAASAFLANDVMMSDTSSPALDIWYHMGVDIQIPSISRAGIILVSILLALDLLCLLAMAIYSAWIPRWTTNLDSFAMMRVGASISGTVPLLATNHAERIETLDETPGWTGNEAEGKIGELCLGGRQPLKKTEYYAAYDIDQSPKPSAIKDFGRAIRRGGYSSSSEQNS